MSIGGGALNLPFSHDTKFLEQWLAPVVEASETTFSIAGTTQTGLAIGTAVLCALAIVGAAQIYLRHKRAPIEPEILAHAWYYDEAVSAFVARSSSRISPLIMSPPSTSSAPCVVRLANQQGPVSHAAAK